MGPPMAGPRGAGWAEAGGPRSTAAPTLPTCAPRGHRLSGRRPDGASRLTRGGGGGGFPSPAVIRAQGHGLHCPGPARSGRPGSRGRGSCSGLAGRRRHFTAGGACAPGRPYPEPGRRRPLGGQAPRGGKGVAPSPVLSATMGDARRRQLQFAQVRLRAARSCPSAAGGAS